MALALLNGPAVEPVTLAAARLHLRVDTTDDDSLISSLITTSRLQVEAALGLGLIAQQWLLQADCWPLNGLVELPLRPVQSVDEIRVRDADGNAETLDSITYAVYLNSDRPRIASSTGYWPIPGARLNGIEIEFMVGFGTESSAVPDDVRQALLLLIAHWYENRSLEPKDTALPPIPNTVSSLLAPYKAARL